MASDSPQDNLTCEQALEAAEDWRRSRLDVSLAAYAKLSRAANVTCRRLWRGPTALQVPARGERLERRGSSFRANSATRGSGVLVLLGMAGAFLPVGVAAPLGPLVLCLCFFS